MLPALAGMAASAASQILSSLLSALDPTTSTSSASSTSSSTSGNATFACGDDSDTASPDNSLTGSTQGRLSGQVLMTLLAMQQQSDATSGTANASTTAVSGITSNSPLDQLFSAMDTNGDGSVSQSEMESYIENLGGTQGEADALYSSLSQIGSTSSATAASSTTSTGISESQMQSALQQSNPFSGMGHHHHHHGMSASNGTSDPADQVANNLIQAMDTNDDGSVSEDEFTNFMTANGSTSANAQSDFASLDTSGSGSLTSADFAKAWENWQAQQSSQSSGTMMASLLDNFAKANSGSATSATTSVSA